MKKTLAILLASLLIETSMASESDSDSMDPRPPNSFIQPIDFWNGDELTPASLLLRNGESLVEEETSFRRKIERCQEDMYHCINYLFKFSTAKKIYLSFIGVGPSLTERITNIGFDKFEKDPRYFILRHAKIAEVFLESAFMLQERELKDKMNSISKCLRELL